MFPSNSKQFLIHLYADILWLIDVIDWSVNLLAILNEHETGLD